MSEQELLIRLAVCAAAAGVATALALLVGGRGRAASLAVLLTGVLIGGACAFGVSRTLGKVPELRPTVNDDWLFWAALFAPIIGLVPLTLPRSARVFAMVVPLIGFAGVATWLTLGNAVKGGFGLGGSSAVSAGLCVAAIALPWIVAQWAALRIDGSAKGSDAAPSKNTNASMGGSGRWGALPGLVAMALLVATLAGGMFYSRSTKGAEVAATIGLAGGSFAVAWLVGVLVSRGSAGRVPALSAVVALVVPMNSLLWLTGLGYNSSPLVATAIGVCAPLGLGVLLIPATARRPLIVRTVIASVIVAALGSAATGIAAKENRSEDDLYGVVMPTDVGRVMLV